MTSACCRRSNRLGMAPKLGFHRAGPASTTLADAEVVLTPIRIVVEAPGLSEALCITT